MKWLSQGLFNDIRSLNNSFVIQSKCLYKVRDQTLNKLGFRIYQYELNLEIDVFDLNNWVFINIDQRNLKRI